MLAFSLALASFVSAAEPSIERSTPRPFGYQLGDRIQHQIVVQADAPYKLVEESLPREGPLDYWLEVRSVDVEERQSGSGHEYRILIDYQIFYASRDVRALELPPLEIKVATEANTQTLRLPAWEFTISPLLETLGARFSEGGVYLRDDALPLLRTAGAARQRLPFWVAGLAMLGLSGLGRYLWLRGSRQPFRCARRELRRQAKTGDEHALQQGLRSVHRAFDKAAGESVFAETLPRLFKRQPGLKSLQSRIEAFFQQSRQLFFAEQSMTEHERRALFNELRHLCRDCARAVNAKC